MKKVLRYAFVAAFVAVAGYGIFINHQSNVMSDLALANIEALAADDEYHVNPDCPNGCTSGSTGCYCFKDYPDQKEVPWS